ncbi:MAG: hypothetical protein IPI60_11730 [Saprospiraceae bacterium]|nr:hypothetical protein [Saprospiraceae bacterium]
MKNSSIAGQKEAVNLLEEMILNNRTPHAILISGPPGSGQLALALALASALQCESLLGGSACGTCQACNKSFALIHPDIHFAFPLIRQDKVAALSSNYMDLFREQITANPYIDKKSWIAALEGENKQANISAEATREIIQKLSLSHYEGRSKIMIIWFPELLGKEGNILLKLIEEPEPDTYLILVTEQEEAILPTILSRCQLIRTRPLNSEDIAHVLEEQMKIGHKQANEIAWLADGNMSEATRILQNKTEEHELSVIDWLRCAYKAHPVEMTQWSDAFNKISREQQKNFLRYGMYFLEQALIAQYRGDDYVLLSAAEKETLPKIVPLLPFLVIEKITERLNEDLAALEQNANSKILAMASTLFIHRTLKNRA